MRHSQLPTHLRRDNSIVETAPMARSEWIRPGVPLRREELDISVRAIDETNRTVEISFSSETMVRRWGWVEVLSHDAGAVDLSRLNSIGVVLFNHDGSYVCGPILNAWLDEQDKKCRAIIKFDDDPEADKIWRKVAAGTLKGVSVGYRVDVWEEVAANTTSTNGRFAGPCDVAVKWTPYEISIVSVPADDSVGVGRSTDSPAPAPSPGTRDESTHQSVEEGEDDMQRHDRRGTREAESPVSPATAGEPLEHRAAPTSAPAPAPVVNAEQIRTAERQRVSEITALCRDFSVDPQQYIADGTAVDQVRSAILEQLRASHHPVPACRQGAVQVGDEALEKFGRAATHAILLRAGVDIAQTNRERNARPAEGADELRGMSLRGLMAEYLRLQGHADAFRYDVERLMRDVFTPDSQFVGILNNTVNASLMAGYNAVPVTFEAWTIPGSNPDFKPTKRFRLSEAGIPEEIPQGGEFKFDQMTDEGIETALKTYGKKFGVTRQLIINDDLGYLARIPSAYVQSARRGVNRACYAILNSNPTIYDGKALFVATGHGNYDGTGAYPSISAFSAGRLAMRKQKNLRGDETINIVPRYVIAPPELETDIDILLTSTANPEGTNSGVNNPMRARFELITDGELTDSLKWFMAADPRVVPAIEVTYLNGKDMPTVESRVAFDSLGMEWRLYFDWGITVLDYRPLYCNKGAAKS